MAATSRAAFPIVGFLNEGVDALALQPLRQLLFAITLAIRTGTSAGCAVVRSVFPRRPFWHGQVENYGGDFVGVVAHEHTASQPLAAVSTWKPIRVNMC